MCGRFTLALSPEDVASLLRLNRELDAELGCTPRWNIAPGQDILAVVRPDATTEITPARFRWGLIPPWADNPSLAQGLINARGETAPDKPSFRGAWRRRRCLIPADGFYEWEKTGKERQPWLFRIKDAPGFCFAGLWERRRAGDGSGHLSTCTILTTGANALMAPIHDRMPVILPSDSQEIWLDPATKPNDLRKMMNPLPAAAMIAHPVTKLVNDPRYDAAACVEPQGLRDDAVSKDGEDSAQGMLF